MNTSLSVLRQQNQAHPYHMVQPSPWPLLTSLSLFLMAIAAVMSFHGYSNGPSLLSLGFLLTLSGMILWFKDITTEATFEGHHTVKVVRGLTMGITLFIISELMAFLSIFWAFFHSSLAPTIEIGGSWPPVGIDTLNPLAIPLLNTVILVSSGAFVTYAHHALIKGNREGAIAGLILTIIFALIFTGLQYFEYSEASFTMSDSIYGTLFYASTGLHGAHVLVGTLYLSVGLLRLIKYHLTSTHHQGLEGGIYYWHFVDVVWLFLYFFVYCWGNSITL